MKSEPDPSDTSDLWQHADFEGEDEHMEIFQEPPVDQSTASEGDDEITTEQELFFKTARGLKSESDILAYQCNNTLDETCVQLGWTLDQGQEFMRRLGMRTWRKLGIRRIEKAEILKYFEENPNSTRKKLAKHLEISNDQLGRLMTKYKIKMYNTKPKTKRIVDVTKDQLNQVSCFTALRAGKQLRLSKRKFADAIRKLKIKRWDSQVKKYRKSNNLQKVKKNHSDECDQFVDDYIKKKTKKEKDELFEEIYLYYGQKTLKEIKTLLKFPTVNHIHALCRKLGFLSWENPTV